MQSARRGELASRHCISNFYQIQFQETGDRQPRIVSLFHCNYYHHFGDEEARLVEDTELKRRIFEAPRRGGYAQRIQQALGVVHPPVFGGDVAAGLCMSTGGSDDREAQHERTTGGGVDVVIGEEDRYEALVDGDWHLAVVRELRDDTVMVALYERGHEPDSFYFERREAGGLWEVPRDEQHLRARRFKRTVWRGEDLRVPRDCNLKLWPGQSLQIEPRGSERGDRAGRLVLEAGAGVGLHGGTIIMEGILSCHLTLEDPGQCARLEFQFVNQLSVKWLGDFFTDTTELETSERAVVLQCFEWVFQRALRDERYRSLGGRGFYSLHKPEPVQPRAYFSRGPSRDPPQVLAYLYRGCTAAPVSVQCGPCLKLDFVTRIVQGRSVADWIADKRRYLGNMDESEVEKKLTEWLRGRWVMSCHVDAQYRIESVHLRKSIYDTFSRRGEEMTFETYFWKMYEKRLQPKECFLYVPRGRRDIYVPASLVYLTGLDEDHRSNPELMKGLMSKLHVDPGRHWQEQRRMIKALDRQADDGALNDWGISVSWEPVRVPTEELEHEPVFYDQAAADSFDRGQDPLHLAVQTERGGKVGFERPPWPHVWSSAPVSLCRWVVFHSASERDLARAFVEEIGQLCRELNGRQLNIGEPRLVPVGYTDTLEEWRSFFEGFRWNEEEFAVVILPPKLCTGDASYYKFKAMLTFPGLSARPQTQCCVPTQMVKSETLKDKPQQRRIRICKNIIQQILVKRGAWLWVSSPLATPAQNLMVVGVDAHNRDGHAIQTLCASVNKYFTQYHVTWRIRPLVQRQGVFACPFGDMLLEALDRYKELNGGALPSRLLVYRGGVSESQEPVLTQRELHDPEGGLFAAVKQRYGPEAPELAYVLARRGTNARFMTEDENNVRSGTCISSHVVADREGDGCFEFYMIAQSYVIATARPTLYSVLHNTLSVSHGDIKQLTYRLCGLYQTFAGFCALPAPLKYATKLLLLLIRCGDTSDRPRDDLQRSCLLFV